MFAGEELQSARDRTNGGRELFPRGGVQISGPALSLGALGNWSAPAGEAGDRNTPRQ